MKVVINEEGNMLRNRMIYEIAQFDGMVNNKGCVEDGGMPVEINLMRRGTLMEATVVCCFHN
jgi:hypothetical protein